MLRQFQAGYTYSLNFDFFDDSGNRFDVVTPLIDFYDPYRQKVLSAIPGLTLAGATVGSYYCQLYVQSGYTIGQWFALAYGKDSQGSTVFASQEPFEIVNPSQEPFWIGLRDFRQYLQVDDSDHTVDGFYKQCIGTAMELIEAYTRRKYSVQGYNEVHEIKHTDRIMLKHFPVLSIAGITATSRIIPRSQSVIVEQLTGDDVTFHYLLNAKPGIIQLKDMAGYDEPYDGMLVSISYYAGYTSLPEHIRSAALGIAANLVNTADTEGIQSLRLADLSFALQAGIFDQKIKDLLSSERVVGDGGSDGVEV